MAAYGGEHTESWVEIEEIECDDRLYCIEVVDGIDGREQWLWSALHFLDKSRRMLSSGRYRQGNCPELDAVNRDLGRLEEELRLMALEADDSTWPEVIEWRAKKTEARETHGRPDPS